LEKNYFGPTGHDLIELDFLQYLIFATNIQPDPMILPNRIFHISEEAGIEQFVPRQPSPSFAHLQQNVVFGVGERLLHNYLLPRECPRVTYYAMSETTLADQTEYLPAGKTYQMWIAQDWLETIKKTVLWCYEFDNHNFRLIDKIADYYVSSQTEYPVQVTRIDNILAQLAKMTQVEVGFADNLVEIAERVKKSTLHFSFIRMRNINNPLVKK
jgi:hypothetical protein